MHAAVWAKKAVWARWERGTHGHCRALSRRVSKNLLIQNAHGSRRITESVARAPSITLHML